ncbi:hypothetical protein EVAR_74870_1 [Eumeta japonica]|uniref:Uncharacterized protein n=1 Tax=Eumeta variegata TaxID=151549 RepID=A0A4C1SPU7_EUMVA|nr:hypothetical protein EVAR_74870_1 [Eumeta japonica]
MDHRNSSNHHCVADLLVGIGYPTPFVFNRSGVMVKGVGNRNSHLLDEIQQPTRSRRAERLGGRGGGGASFATGTVSTADYLRDYTAMSCYRRAR